MSYHKVLGLLKEPFSTSPDPKFFYQSKGHKSVLTRIRISIKLRRGLCLVLGDIGTGKTTLSRKLAQILGDEKEVVFRMILNPMYRTEQHFLEDLNNLYDVKFSQRKKSNEIDYLNYYEKYLFSKGLEERKKIVLLIDEAQLLNSACLEVLRTLLNYETNEYKLLQVILVGQKEFLPVIRNIRNFWDRISLRAIINPLDMEEAKAMIEYRLQQAGYPYPHKLFTDEAIETIHEFTNGYPRRISMLCHDALEYIVMHDIDIVTKDIVTDLRERELAVAFDGNLF